MTRKHYHVLSGLTGGYLPNSNDVCATRREAEASARWLASTFRDDETRVSGSARDGWYNVGEYEYIKITECMEPDCMEGEDY